MANKEPIPESSGTKSENEFATDLHNRFPAILAAGDTAVATVCTSVRLEGTGILAHITKPSEKLMTVIGTINKRVKSV